MPLGHCLRSVNWNWEAHYLTMLGEDKSLALELRRSAQRLRLSTVSLSVRRQQMSQDVGIGKSKALTILSKIGVMS